MALKCEEHGLNLRSADSAMQKETPNRYSGGVCHTPA